MARLSRWSQEWRVRALSGNSIAQGQATACPNFFKIHMKTKQKPFMIPGLGEKPSLYKTRKLFKYATIADMDWNTGKFKPQIPLGTDVGIGFSMGCHMILETAYKRKSLKTLVLCSMTPGVQSLSILKSVERYIFISG